MSVDKSLMQQMVAAGQIQPQPVSVEIEEELPPSNIEIMDDGGAEVTFGEEEASLLDVPHTANLVDFVDNDELDELSSDLIYAFEADERSRKDWAETYIQGLDLLGLKFEERSEPWDGACGVFHPMLTDSVVRFQAQTIQEVFPASGPVKASIVGKITEQKTKQLGRVVGHMNYISTKKMVEYRNETEKLLFSLPIAGSAFRKMYHDPTKDRPCSMFVPAEDFVVAYNTSDLETAERATHVMRKSENAIRKLQVSGFYTDIELPSPNPDESNIRRKYSELTGSSPTIEFDDEYTLLEMIVDYDVPGFENADGIALPYVITIDKSSGKVLSIYRNWKEGDLTYTKRQHFVHYQYLPGLGFYGFGLVHMIGGLSKSATSLLRQLVDSGTLANLPGGLKSRGLRIKGDDTPIKPGEFRDVDVPGGNIRDNIAFLPYKEPSSVLYQLLRDIVEEGRRFASAADMKAADMNGEAPVGTTLAILEREMKVMSAIQARIHAAMGKELLILADIIKDFGPEEYPYEVDDGATIRDDFDERIDILPVSDPNAGTMAQRIMQYQAALQLAAQAPHMYDLPTLHRQMIGVLGIENAEKIIPSEDDLKPTDPITETMNIINGKPVKAFIYQDHEAHIQAHMAAAQNPELMKLLEKSPSAPAIMAAAAAHLSEHLAFTFRKKIEEELGVQLPSPEEDLPEDIELRLSRLVAPAAAQLTGKAQQKAQAEENAKKQEDPIIQQAEKELAIKEGKVRAEADRDMKRIEADMQKHRDKLALDREKLNTTKQLESAKIAVKLSDDERTQAAEEKRQKVEDMADGFKTGMDVVRTAIQAGNIKGKRNGD
jgi:hypothetical protein